MNEVWKQIKVVFWVIVTVVIGFFSFWFARKSEKEKEFEKKDKDLVARLSELQETEKRLKREMKGSVVKKKMYMDKLIEVQRERKAIEIKLGIKANEKANEFDHILGGITRKRTGK